MANLNGFNAAEVEPATSFEPIPAGKYLAAVTASEMKPTKNGKGSYLELTFTVLEGPYKNRQLWHRLNLDNPNATAVKIARAELSALCHAVGILQPRDSVELHNVPLCLTVKLKRRSDVDEFENVIAKYEPKTAATGSPQAPQAKAADNTPPWKR